MDPDVRAFDGEEPFLTTATAAGLRSVRWRGFRGTDRGVDQPRASEDGRPLYFEVWDDNTFFDALIGGFVAYPDSRDAAEVSGDRVAEYTAPILWDWKEPRAVSRSGFARVTVRFLDRPDSSVSVPRGEAKP